MRIPLVAAALAPCMLLVATPASSEPIFILNCRLINVDDKLFRQHCKAQERECGGVSCFGKARQKARTVDARIRAVRGLETPLSTIESAAETSPDAGSIGISADTTTERTADQSISLGGGGDSPVAGGGEGTPGSSDVAGAAGDGAIAGSQPDGSDAQDGGDMGSADSAGAGTDGS